MDGNKFQAAKWKTQVPSRRSSNGQTAPVQLLLVLNWKKSSSVTAIFSEVLRGESLGWFWFEVQECSCMIKQPTDPVNSVGQEESEFCTGGID